MSILPRALISAFAFLIPSFATAGDLTVPVGEPLPVYQAAPVASPGLVFTIRGGASVTPDYFGSGDYSVGPDFAVGLNFLRLPGGRSFGSYDPNNPQYGLGLRGSFRYIDERSAADYPELNGLNDVDTSVELGLGLAYSSRNFDAFADLRYGVVGHESFVGEVGADVKFQANDRLTLSAGPRLFIGSDKYSSTYFGVTAAEAGAVGSNFAGQAFNAGGGLLSAGVEVGAKYKINDDWGLEGAVTWDRFTGDAADSPIVQQGERDQYGVRIGITRRITLDF
ncbi:MipA/OmpV family protein [Oceaniovalibus sp. ACAM 378]|uniref:MipA/OmpV family protein n=1 Tax=Oceaniovalibus sp. ACAM 378 TaxID=2599923 RepID=UPI0011D7653F|nr:MipA/OmpV family protein [Oceaniovalibus sp. ACAM 378]TYB91026.1 MipA/OmpV family protein [Oceaniovalibus sp. ACAM 378]